ncbi:MAG: hypothetical protein GY884_14170 [Proteobacteria bacterium]|nr:hypothetical protein [Pseudomonadota bacterium]
MLLLLSTLSCTDAVTDTAACEAETVYRDQDGDGYGAEADWAHACRDAGWVLLPGDCDDNDATASPDGDAGCDCLDAPATTTWYADADGDGAGDDDDAIDQCGAPEGYVAIGGDCAPTDPTIGPLAEEVYYDGVDQDCDGKSDDDADGDGFDAAEMGGDDCDDADPGVSPDQAEVCDADGVDEDCDGLVNEDDPDARDWRTWYEDLDGDGHGTEAGELVACSPPEGYAEASDDCDDTKASVSPSAEEVCGNGLDDDCNEEALECGPSGDVDVGTAWTWSETSATGAFALGDLGHGPELVFADYEGNVRIGDLDDDRLVLHSEVEGWTIATSLQVGDVDGDGQGDLVVGSATAWGSDYYGRVFVHPGPVGEIDLRGDASVELFGRLDDGGAFGTEVVLGDLTGDGVADIITAASQSDHYESSGGEVVVFDALEGSQDAYDAFVTVRGDANDQLMRPLTGDVDGDGVDDLLIGASESRTFGSVAGMLVFVAGPDGDYSIADAVTMGEGSSSLRFGSAVGLHDLDDDGELDVLVGATGYSGSQGAVYVLDDLEAELFEDAVVGMVVGTSTSLLGSWIASPGDIDHDGVDDVTLSASYADQNGSNSGTVWILSGPVSGTSSVDALATHSLSGPTGGVRLDRVFSGADLSGDGQDDLALFSWAYDVYVVPSGPGI